VLAIGSKCSAPSPDFPPSSPFQIDELISGPLDDAKCNIEAVDQANNAQLACILSDLMDTTFFRLFPVKLGKECPFFNKAEPKAPETCDGDAADGVGMPLSSMKSFASSPLTRDTEPEPACSLDTTGSGAIRFAPATDEVDESLSRREGKVIGNTKGRCDDENQPTFWLDMCDDIEVGGPNPTVVNLRKNPERWTGYNGSAVWRAIYQENCFPTSSSGAFHYEDRVLYKLLSAMHTSINVHIATNHYPPRKGKRTHWEPNPAHFVERYAEHPDRIKNLHFGFVVLLRAVRKAGPYLLKLDYRTDPSANASAPEGSGRHTRALVERLLQTDLLKSCNEVFSAFDESLLFHGERDGTPVAQLKINFKSAFRNISKILDCVSCQKCKLHGKLALLGLGTALKALLLPAPLLDEGLKKHEVVALINILGKFSKAIQGAKELTSLYRNKVKSLRKAVGVGKPVGAEKREKTSDSFVLPTDEIPSTYGKFPGSFLESADKAVSIISGLKLSEKDEDILIDAALAFDPRLLILARHYAYNPTHFVKHALRILKRPLPPGFVGSVGGFPEGVPGVGTGRMETYDLVVVGGGLTGLTSALSILDAGGRVALLEKEPFVGGNSAWASSGVNAARDLESEEQSNKDSKALFFEDTFKSGNGDKTLVHALVNGSYTALQWIQHRLDVELDEVSQLGGHSVARTHRGDFGMVGQELVRRMANEVKKFKEPQLTLLTSSRVTRLIGDSESGIRGVEYKSTGKKGAGSSGSVFGRFIAVTTGGYANDQEIDSVLHQARPELKGMPTTNGRWATGDGIKLSTKIGAGSIDLDKVQVHPTAFLDPSKPNATRKTLCAELMRGVGGILLTRNGARFIDELAPRDVVVAAMKKASKESDKEGFIILLSEAMRIAAGKHAEHYLKRGLMSRFSSLSEVETWAGVSLTKSVQEYNMVAEKRGIGPFGKQYYHNTPMDINSPFLAGIVVPAVHYTMGGIRISSTASVLTSSGTPIPNLLAGGEVAGGTHGKNRLGGNALTECLVFGRIIAHRVLEQSDGGFTDAEGTPHGTTNGKPKISTLRAVKPMELAKHTSMDDCWIAIDGKVYDMTDFLEEHPAGPEAILEVSGRDATEEFKSIHTLAMLEDFDPLGTLVKD